MKEKIKDILEMAWCVFLWLFVNFLFPALVSGTTAVIITVLIFLIKNQR